MKHLGRCLILLLCLLVFSYAAAEVAVDVLPTTEQVRTRSGMVRVRLDSLNQPEQLTITLRGNYTAYGSTSLPMTDGQTVKVSVQNGELVLTTNGQKTAMGQTLLLQRVSADTENCFSLKEARMPSNTYPGDLRLTVEQTESGRQIVPVAYVYIEDYLVGVLPYEMGSTAPTEALKAQAVAARTYTLSRMAAQTESAWDVVDTTNDQVYYGTPSAGTACTEAVQATEGVALTYGDTFAETLYTASNGGQTESAQNAWGTTSCPYLTVKEDPFDLMNPASAVKQLVIQIDNHAASQPTAWKNALEEKACAALNQSDADVTSVDGITLYAPRYAEPSCLYTMMDVDVTVLCGDTYRQMTLTFDIFEELEAALDLSINATANELWSVTVEGETFVLTVRRYGHGIGMSQRGAMQMAELGYSWEQILGFYYEGCTQTLYVFGNQPGGDEDGTLVTSAPITHGTVTAESGLNLRRTPDASGEILCAIYWGERVPVYSLENGWAQVTWNGQSGYCMAAYLDLENGAAEEMPGQQAEETVTENSTAYIASDGVGLLAAPMDQAPALLTMEENTPVQVYLISDGWCRIACGEQIGYVRLEDLRAGMAETEKATDETFVSSTRYVSTSGGGLNLRDQPSSEGNVLAVLERGTEVELVLDQGEWSFVRHEDQLGYVMSRYLNTEAPAAETEAAPEEYAA